MRNIKDWIKKNYIKLLIVIILHVLITYALNLPYINLIKIILSSVAILIDFIVVLYLFRPKKEHLLWLGIALFPVSAFFALFHKQSVIEPLGNLSYLLIITYVILSLKEVRENNHD